MLVQTNGPLDSLFYFNFGDCSVGFPQTPQTIKTDFIVIDTEAIDLRKIICENTLETYLFARAYLSKSYLQKGSKSVLNEITSYFLGDFGCEDLEEYAKNITYKGYPGREFKIVEDNSGLVMKLYLVKQKFYLLLVASDHLKKAVNFIDSFQLLSA